MLRTSFPLNRPSSIDLLTAIDKLACEDITEEMRAFLRDKRMTIYEMRMHVLGDCSKDLTLDTHLSEVKGFFLHREYRARNAVDEVVLIASARLVITDLKKMMPVMIPQSWVEVTSKALLPTRGLRPKLDESRGKRITFCEKDADENGIILHRAYLAPIFLMHSERTLRTLDVTYEKESTIDDLITLSMEEKEDALLACYWSDGNIITHIAITWK